MRRKSWYLSEQLTVHWALPSDGLDCIRDSLACTDRIAGIVRQLLSAARVAGEQNSAAPYRLAAALAVAMVASRPALGDWVVIQSDIPDDMWVLGEEGVLGQVLVNVIVNAAHAIAEAKGSGRICLTTEMRADRVLLRIADDGPGMRGGAKPASSSHFSRPNRKERGRASVLPFRVGWCASSGVSSRSRARRRAARRCSSTFREEKLGRPAQSCARREVRHRCCRRSDLGSHAHLACARRSRAVRRDDAGRRRPALAEAHADRVLAKPLDHMALRAIVRRLLREVPARTVVAPIH